MSQNSLFSLLEQSQIVEPETNKTIPRQPKMILLSATPMMSSEDIVETPKH